MSQYTTSFIPASETTESPLPRWPSNFPLAGAIYIEYIAKRGHFVNKNDRLEALKRNGKRRIGTKVDTHYFRLEWLDKEFPRDDMTRYAMDTVSIIGARARQSLYKHFMGSYPRAQITTETAKDIINEYNNYWLNYQSPAVVGESSLRNIEDCLAAHMMRCGTYGHDTRSKGCSGGDAAGIDDWEMVDGPEEGNWTEVTKDADGEV